MTNSQPERIRVKIQVKGILMKKPEELLRELLEGSKKFCRAVGLQEDLVSQIIDAENDWALTLKVDALIETAAKEVLRRNFHFTLGDRTVNNEVMEEFIEGLGMQGKTSVRTLLKAAGFEKADLSFIEAVRKVRNAYAHDIRNINRSLLELLKRRNDRLALIKHLALLNAAADQDLIAEREKQPKLLRLEITLSTLRFLNNAYHVAIN